MNRNTIVTEAVGVVFSAGGRVYSFDLQGLDLVRNEKVVCQTSRGQELGRVVKAQLPGLPRAVLQPLKCVLRRATERDLEQARENQAEAKHAMQVFRGVIKELGINLEADLRRSSSSTARGSCSRTSARSAPTCGR